MQPKAPTMLLCIGISSGMVTLYARACIADERRTFRNSAVVLAAPVVFLITGVGSDNYGDPTYFEQPSVPLASEGSVAYRRNVLSFMDVGIGMGYMHLWRRDFGAIRAFGTVRLFIPTQSRVSFGFLVEGGGFFSAYRQFGPNRVWNVGGEIRPGLSLGVQVTELIRVPIQLQAIWGRAPQAFQSAAVEILGASLATGAEFRF